MSIINDQFIEEELEIVNEIDCNGGGPSPDCLIGGDCVG